jgi:hypothetical protein
MKTLQLAQCYFYFEMCKDIIEERYRHKMTECANSTLIRE